MKKLIFTIIILISLSAAVFSQEASEADTSENSWKEIGQQGMKALRETGKFFKDAGIEIGSTVKEGVKSAVASEKCYGEWVYKGKSTKTVISCNSDGTMLIEQKTGLETLYWKGVYTVALNTITFSVKESGTKTLFSSKSEQIDEKWHLLYTVQEDEVSMKIISSQIPADKDGTKFSKGIIFTKK